jgi:hypothetical protein
MGRVTGVSSVTFTNLIGAGEPQQSTESRKLRRVRGRAEQKVQSKRFIGEQQ